MSGRWFDESLYAGFSGCDWRSRLRIVHVCKFFPPERGGMETYVRDLALEQARNGHEVVVLAHTRFASKCETPARNCEVRRFKVGFWAGKYLPVATGLPLGLWRTLREFRPNIVHLHCPNPAALWCLPLRRCSLVVHWHSDVIFPENKRPSTFSLKLWRWMEQALLKRAGRIIATSQPYLDTSEFLACWRDKCVVSPLCVRAEKPEILPGLRHPAVDFLRGKTGGNNAGRHEDIISLLRQEHSRGKAGQPGGLLPESDIAAHPGRALPDWNSALRALCSILQETGKDEVTSGNKTGIALLSVGRLAHYKGLDVLIRAVATVQNIRCCIIGDGEERENLHILVRKLGLEDRIMLAGEVSDEILNACYEACDVFCLPSTMRTEAFGIVLLEALRAGKWCIASDVPGSGIATVVRHGENGWLVGGRGALDRESGLDTTVR